METIYFVAIISFIAGILGYIILQFWIRPIIAYNKIRHNISLIIKYYYKSKNVEDLNEKIKLQMKKWDKTNKQHSFDLSISYNENLPNWYKMLLGSRGESPIDAANHLMILSNNQNYENIEKHIKAIKHYLKIK